MKAVLQRVSQAKLHIDNKETANINRGLVIFLGISNTDDHETALKLLDKIVKLRIFADDTGKINLSVSDIDGEVLIVSQFTLYADTKKGNRPSFINVAEPNKAEELYEYFVNAAKFKFKKVGEGVFGANMQVNLTNDGPFTIVLEINQ